MRIVDLFTENCKWELGEDSLPPTLKLRDARRLLHNAGFVSDRSKGSHEYWKHPISGLKFSLPAHHTTIIQTSRHEKTYLRTVRLCARLLRYK